MIECDDKTFGRAGPHPADTELQANTSGDNPHRRTAVPAPAKKTNPRLMGFARPAAVIGPSQKKGPAAIKDGDRAIAVQSPFLKLIFPCRPLWISCRSRLRSWS